MANKFLINYIQRRFMPANVPPTATGKRRFRLAVETDAHKLVNYCCGLNYHIDEPLVKLKPDNEYPDWLWKLRITPKPNSWEMEKGTKEYYLRLAEEGRDRNYLLKMAQPKERKIVNKDILDRDDYMRYKRYAALAHLEDDVGLPQGEDPAHILEDTMPRVHARDMYLATEEDKIIYMDKLGFQVGRPHNYYYDEGSTFAPRRKNIEKRPSIRTPAFQDSKQRNRYSAM